MVLLNDNRCVIVQIKIAGRADFRDNVRCNRRLSKRRTVKTVAQQLSSAELNMERLKATGRSELSPVDPRHPDKARRKNCLVEISEVN
jgi:outer membrane protein OmpA-like peptidoglycan-associated protein